MTNEIKRKPGQEWRRPLLNGAAPAGSVRRRKDLTTGLKGWIAAASISATMGGWVLFARHDATQATAAGDESAVITAAATATNIPDAFLTPPVTATVPPSAPATIAVSAAAPATATATLPARQLFPARRPPARQRR